MSDFSSSVQIPLITVFTPTYNRANLLQRGYDALCKQTNHNFMWLIVDDGSSDNTRDCVKSWMCSESLVEDEQGFIGCSKDYPWLKIHYSYKDNGGLHTAYNKAIDLMNTEICVCIDSDDFMPCNAIDIICKEWGICKQKGLIGIIGRDYTLDNKVIGPPLPLVDSVYVIELMDRFRHTGDKKIVMRVDLLKNTPTQITYNGEKNFNPIYRILQLDQFGKYKLCEENFCFVDYQETGMAANIYKQYINSANSFSALRCLYISLKHTTWRFRLINLLHLSSSSILAHNTNWLRQCKYPILAYMMLPFGFLLSRYILMKAKNK